MTEPDRFSIPSSAVDSKTVVFRFFTEEASVSFGVHLLASAAARRSCSTPVLREKSGGKYRCGSHLVLGYLKFSLNEGSLDDEFHGFIRKLAGAPSFNLPMHRLEVALHAVDADGNAVLQPEVLGVFC